METNLLYVLPDVAHLFTGHVTIDDIHTIIANWSPFPTSMDLKTTAIV